MTQGRSTPAAVFFVYKWVELVDAPCREWYNKGKENRRIVPGDAMQSGRFFMIE